MNTSFIFPSGGGGSRRKSRRGMALILVLSAVILAAGLVVSLLFLVKSGRIVSGAYAGQVQTRVLANTALNLVIGQIRDATSDTTMTQTWASQPGAIRVYNSTNPISAGTDNFVAGYKLFSSSVMTATTESALTQDVEGDSNPVPTGWAAEVGKYVNLNQPVTMTVSGVTSTVYPIVDPAALPSTANSPNLVTSTSGVQGFSDTDTTDYPNLAMPVEWLYQLANGTFASATYNNSNGTVTVTGASAANPIVARVAFWTDDETSKVNINTASEGLYWDEPRVNTQNTASTVTSLNSVGGSGEGVVVSSCSPSQYSSATTALTTAVGTNLDPSQSPNSNEFTAVGTDQAYASNQPGANEFNRFPGHPATTSLSAVFSELTPTQIFSILPRYSLNGLTTAAPGTPPGGTAYPYSTPLYTGGSVMGTVSWIYYTALSAVSNSGTNIGYNATVSLNANHLYSSGAEVMLQPTRILNGNGGMAMTASTSFPITPTMVQQRKFFLTAESRAPELNLFGCPRVSMWPVNPLPASGGYPYSTAYDQMAAFCSTLQPTGISTTYPFYFQRETSTSPTSDMNITDSSGNLVNQRLYKYLQAMTGSTSLKVPGFGGNFYTKYGTSGEINQILTEALDYIRCTNLFDGSLEYNTSGTPSAWMSSNSGDSLGNEFTEGVHAGLSNAIGYPGYGQALPLQYTASGTATMGLGRTYTVSQVSLVFICTADAMEGGTTSAAPYAAGVQSNNPAVNITLDALTPLTITPTSATIATNATGWQKRVQAILLVELASPMEGYPALCPSITAKLTGTAPGFKFLNVYQAGQTTQTSYAPWGAAQLGNLYTFDDYSGTSNGPDTSRSSYNPQGPILWEGIGACGYGGIFPFLGMGYDPKAVGTLLTGFLDAQNTTPWWFSGSPRPVSRFPLGVPLIPYALISAPFTVNVPNPPGATATMSIDLPGTLTISLYYAPDGKRVATGSYTGASGGTPGVLYQTINIPLPSSPLTVPIPSLNKDSHNWILAQTGYDGNLPQSTPPDFGRLFLLGSSYVNGWGEYDSYHHISSFVQPGDTVISEAVVDGDFRLNAAMQTVPTTRFALVGGATAAAATTTIQAATSTTPGLATTQGSTQTLTTPYFTTQIFPPYGWGGTIFGGKSYKVDVSNPDLDGTTLASGTATTAVRQNEGSYVSGLTMPAFCTPEVPSAANYPTSVTKPSDTGDWDNGLAATPDGPFANMPDTGTAFTCYDGHQTIEYPSIPYFDAPFFENSGTQRSFSPNRLIPSSGMFGSLPTGVMESKPWQTLRFRPQSSTAGPDYTPAYSVSIPDYLFMDLFWMPVVAPYAISEPFSTAGKINMNYQILPFTYIKRQTGLYAVLKHERILAIPSTTAAAALYKGDMNSVTQASSIANPNGFAYGQPTGGAVQSSDSTAWRHQLNVPATLVQFDNMFANNQIFWSPSQLCDLYLVPQNGDATSLGLSGSSTESQLLTAMSGTSGYWSTHLLTGDNTRERPYTVIYPRLTTQSNTYRVHYWVQTLRKSSSGNQTIFVDPNSTTATVTNGLPPDAIRGQLRGSFLIERYLQSDDSRLSTWASSNYPTPTANLNSYYKIRILGNTDFNLQ